MAASGSMVDPTKSEKFRVVIGDELLGKSSKEVFTGVRYNHRPAEEAPGSARISHSKPGSGTFDLAFREPDGTKYNYNGTRAMNDGQYVLVFDPNKRTFVLHKLDSLFNMNLVGTPDSDDPAALKKQHPFLSGHGVPRHLEQKAAMIAGTGKTAGKAAGKAKPNTALRAPKKQPPKKKEVAKKPSQKAAAAVPQETIALPQAPSAPSAASSPPPKQKRKEVNSDDDDEESDDGLEIVYTDSQEAKPRMDKGAAFSPPFQSQPTRRFSEFIKDHNDEDDEDADADGEPESDNDVPEVMDEDEPDHDGANFNDYDKPDQDDFGDLEEDLEAALEQELAAEESDVSEED